MSSEKTTADLFREWMDLSEVIADKKQELRDEPNHNSNHIASMISGEIEAYLSVEQDRNPIDEAVAQLIEAAEQTLETCERLKLRNALTALRERLENSR